MTSEDAKKNEFFKKMSKVITDLKLSGKDIYNANVSVLNVDNRGCKTIAPKASKTVFMTKSEERSQNTTIVATCSVTGTVILPPVTIYKGSRPNEVLMNGTLEDKIFSISKDYIDSDKQNKRKIVDVQLQ
jgi:hypothetical protein